MFHTCGIDGGGNWKVEVERRGDERRRKVVAICVIWRKRRGELL